MKKVIVYFSMFLVVASLVFAASVSRDLPSRADPNSELTVKLQVSGADTSGLFTLEEELPAGITIKEWNIVGAKESKDVIATRTTENRQAWSFTPTSSSATVEYKINLGASGVTFGTLVFFDKSGQSKTDPQTLRVAAISCGDGICEGSENSDSCVADCPKAAIPTPPAAEVTPEVEEKKMPIGVIVAVIIVIIGLVIYFTAVKKKK